MLTEHSQIAEQFTSIKGTVDHEQPFGGGNGQFGLEERQHLFSHHFFTSGQKLRPMTTTHSADIQVPESFPITFEIGAEAEYAGPFGLATIASRGQCVHPARFEHQPSCHQCEEIDRMHRSHFLNSEMDL
jgi:hypothetical protein